ncbi:BnaA01g35790D [Brassica napus]|uniref:BnaA01g35790D protein n=2 Tax=Brassica TaxID=3705 RepID=A0A078I8N3_BRANA|nr:BnaA01g35790D [Brassica napus]
MTRPPMTSGGRSYGTGPTTQPSGSQAAGAQRHVANHEPVENREEVAHVPVQRDVRVLHPARQNGAKWYALPL